jgi:hypothetical protein
LALAGTGDARDDDDYHHEGYRDCGRGYRAYPVETWGRWGRGERDFQAHAGQDFLGEPSIVVLAGGVAEGVGDGTAASEVAAAADAPMTIQPLVLLTGK